MEKWTAADMPDQSGRIAIVTGANSGIGYEAARELARKGARVVMACRSVDKAEAAKQTLLAENADAALEVMALDLADLASVRAFADTFLAAYDRLDLLINNAGVMATPPRKTADGFELQFGTNHLGHYVLTGLLLGRLTSTGGARVVTVSSSAHRGGSIHFDDINLTSGYTPFKAYGQSKLANILFASELDRKLKAAGHDVISTSVHPGWAATELQPNMARNHNSWIQGVVMKIANTLIAQSQEQGALPTLYAATAPGVTGGAFYGPHRQARGYPVEETPTAAARNADDAARLWQVSEDMTGVEYPL